MAHVPMGDIRQLWNETSNKSWNGFCGTLKKHEGSSSGIDDATVRALEDRCTDFQRSNQRFPKSEQELYDLIEHAPPGR